MKYELLLNKDKHGDLVPDSLWLISDDGSKMKYAWDKESGIIHEKWETYSPADYPAGYTKWITEEEAFLIML